jgi:Lar family restriction alleviation protein
MHRLNDQWPEVIDGVDHMVKAVERLTSHRCAGCCHARVDEDGNYFDCAIWHDDSRDEFCAVDGGINLIVKDLGILRDGLLPCPFCGEYLKLMYDPHMKNYWFFCEGCEIETMYYDTEQQAVDAWNRRV